MITLIRSRLFLSFWFAGQQLPFGRKGIGACARARARSPVSRRSMNKKETRTSADSPSEKKLNFNIVPSLEYLATIKVTVLLWQHQYLKPLPFIYKSVLKPSLQLCEKRNFSYQCWWWYATEKLNLQAIINEELDLPESIKSNIINLIRPIEREINYWVAYQDRKVQNVAFNKIKTWREIRTLFESIVWTYLGAINYVETAKCIINTNLLSYKEMYRMACFYCLEDSVYEVAPYVVYPHYLDELDFDEQPLLYYWTCCVTGDVAKLQEITERNRVTRSIASYMLTLPKVNHNEGAFTYFWKQLSKEEKYQRLVSLMETNFKPRNLNSLISDLEEQQQKNFFLGNTGSILCKYLEIWPQDYYFLPAAYHMRDIFSTEQFSVVLALVGRKIIENRCRYDRYDKYNYMLKELWEYAPETLRKSVFEYNHGLIFSRLVIGVKLETHLRLIQLTLENSSTEFKRRVINSRNCYYLFTELVKNDQLELFATFISRAFSAEDVDEFKTNFVFERKDEITLHFFKNKKVCQFDEFLVWGFRTESEINEYKATLPSNMFKILLKYSVNNNDFSVLETFLNVCFNKNEEKIKEFKAARSNNV